jgi:sugar (pentulose or hexulose) kinase
MSLWSREGQCLEKRTRTNAAKPADPYMPLDTRATADWLIESLAEFASHPVEAIIPVAHGAAVAGIREGAPAFPPLDYEWEIPADCLSEYREQRDAFALTGSPELPAGLNFGAQLHYLESLGSLAGVTLMPYAQYWAWLLSGAATSQVTSLGCHSDLWLPGDSDFSPMAKRRGWAAQFAPMVHASDVVGTLRPELAERTGFSPTVRIHAGLHDSNAALVAARGCPELAAHEMTVLSTGTWFVAMRTPGEPVDLAALPETRDCLVNVDVEGQAVPSARFMGGREVELLGGGIDRPGTAGLAKALHVGTMVLPAHVQGCGPFAEHAGSWIDKPENEAQQQAAVALYAALMADCSLDLIGAKQRLLIEGRFAASEIFVRALATLRPGTKVFTANAEADVSFGALRLIEPSLSPPGTLTQVQPLDADLDSYRSGWLSHLENTA